VARKAPEPARIAGSGFIFGSENFWEPPRRSWPHPPTELEVLATRAGLDDEELRALLHDAIQQRLREKGQACERLDNRLEKRENGS
jgi:hypothetical protein